MRQAVTGDLLTNALAWADRIGAAANTAIIVDSGTLLGLMREGSLISGDMDLDFSVVDAGGEGDLLAALDNAHVQVWRYGGRVYKIEVPSGSGGPPVPAEFKFFYRHGDEWRCPAIRSPGMWGRGRGKGSFLRRMIRPAWTMLKRRDVSRSPLQWMASVDTWAVPAGFFDNLIPVGNTTNCFIPADSEAYLARRYGEWKTPVSEWVSCRDDGCYRQIGS